MTIDLVTGPLGTGKSYYMVRKGVEYLLDGKMAVFNFQLAPDFSERVAFRRFGRFFKQRAAEKARSIEARTYELQSLPDLLRLRVRKEAPWVRVNGYGKTVLREGTVFLGLDEAHQWMNARLWTDADRGEVVRFFALARKRGFHVYLGSQRDKNLDVQVRELFEDHIRLNNLKRSARLLGVPVIPWNWFVAIRESHHYPGEMSGRDIYVLNWCKDLYDTMDTASFGIEEDPSAGAILLPGWREDDAPTGDDGDSAPTRHALADRPRDAAGTPRDRAGALPLRDPADASTGLGLVDDLAARWIEPEDVDPSAGGDR